MSTGSETTIPEKKDTRGASAIVKRHMGYIRGLKFHRTSKHAKGRNANGAFGGKAKPNRK